MNLSDERFAEISAKLPDASAIQSRLLLPVDLIVARAGPQSKIDIAIVCLRDASETFWEVGYVRIPLKAATHSGVSGHP
jgi:hypothetical protein